MNAANSETLSVDKHGIHRRNGLGWCRMRMTFSGHYWYDETLFQKYRRIIDYRKPR